MVSLWSGNFSTLNWKSSAAKASVNYGYRLVETVNAAACSEELARGRSQQRSAPRLCNVMPSHPEHNKLRAGKTVPGIQ